MTKDLTNGSPFKCILSFAIPVFFGMLFQQLYNLADAMIVSKFLGTDAFAGVGSTSSLYFLVIGTCIGICNGFAIPIAQMFGAKNEAMLKRFTAACIILCVILSAILTAVTTLSCKGVLTLMGTTEESFDYAYIYIVIIFAGIPFTFLYNMVSAMIRSLGDSKTPVYFLLLSSVINIVLDLLFIIVLNLGVAGAALATVVAQAVSGLASLIFMICNFKILRLSKSDFKPNSFTYWRLCSIGLPMGLQYTITAVGSVVVQSAINSFGEATVAGVSAASKVYSLISCPLEALGTTMATYTGQNIGANRFDRLGKGLFVSTMMGFVFSGVIFVAMIFVGNDLSLLFLKKEETKALADAYKYTLICTAGFPLLTCISTFRFSIQGMGYSPLAMIAGVLEMIARCFVGLVLPDIIGYTSVCISSPAAWFAADLFLIPAFFLCKKQASKHYNIPKVDNGHKTIV